MVKFPKMLIFTVLSVFTPMLLLSGCTSEKDKQIAELNKKVDEQAKNAQEQSKIAHEQAKQIEELKNVKESDANRKMEQDANRKMELQEKCSNDAKNYFMEQYGGYDLGHGMRAEITNHYSEKLAGCYLMVFMYDGTKRLSWLLYDANERYAIATYGYSDNKGNFKGIHYSKQVLDTIIYPYMND